MSTPEPRASIERLIAALNAHDIEGVVACFAPDYRLESPIHPARNFRGTDQVRRNWTQFFAGVPDIHVDLLRVAINGQEVWTEQEQRGTRRDGMPHLTRGVFIFGVKDGLIHSGRMFHEPVDNADVDTDGAVKKLLAGST